MDGALDDGGYKLIIGGKMEKHGVMSKNRKVDLCAREHFQKKADEN